MQKVEGVGKDDEASICWFPPVTEVTEVCDKVGGVKVLVLGENFLRQGC